MNRRLGLALSFAMLSGGAAAGSRGPEPSYVTITIMGPEAIGSAVGMKEDEWNSSLRRSVEGIKERFGPQPAGRERYVGFSVALVPTLNLTPGQLKAQVVLALDLAERYEMPVFFHLDDAHFWWRSPELSKNPEMVEWTDFPKAGEEAGPVVPRYWLPWGDPPSVYPAPPPCFACPAFRTALASRLRECVAKPIARRLATWNERGKGHLFAGIAAGNETAVMDFREAARVGWPKSAYGMDTTQGRPVKVPARTEDFVPIGYHSLYAMGYTQPSIERSARSRKTSVEEIVAELFFRVAHDYAEFQTKTLHEAGIPTDRLYTHFTSSNRSTGDEFRPPAAGRAGSGNLPPPIESSVNPYSRPGFTIVHDVVDLDRLVALLDQAHAPEHGRAWAAVESYVTTGQPGAPQTEKQYSEYLGGLLAHGAKVVNIYGWVDRPEGAGPYDIKRSGAIPAVKKWLAGEPLPATWSGAVQLARRAAIRAKLERLQKSAQEAVRGGRNPILMMWSISRFQHEFEPLVKDGKIAEAEAVLDRALARIQGGGHE